jgi:hypothetical protein
VTALPPDPDPLYVEEDRLWDPKSGTFVPRRRSLLVPMFLSAIAGAVVISLVWAYALAHAGAVGPPLPEPSFAPVPTITSEVRTVPSAPAVLATPRPTPRPTSVPVARGHVRTGTASFMAPKYGRYYLALPEGPGHRVTICGRAACVTRISTDAGPDLAMQRAGRVADVAFWDFATICGCDPWAKGLVRARVTW